MSLRYVLLHIFLSKEGPVMLYCVFHFPCHIHSFLWLQNT